MITDIEGIISGSAHAENVVASLNDLKGKLPALIEERKQIDALADEIGKLIHREDLYVTGLPQLAEIIKKLRELSGKIDALRNKVNDLKKALKVLKAKLSGMDSEKKLNDLLKAVLDQVARCKQLESDID